jgi:undecaprenyl phosphate-alpha-L-ara4N flippase subunit ArnE
VKSAALAFAAAGAVLAAFGQVSLKAGAAGRVASLDFLNSWIFLGLALYLAGTVLWIIALSSVPLTAVYPFTALTYVLVNVLAFVLLGERLSVQGMLGTGVVLLGLFLVATSLEVDHASR